MRLRAVLRCVIANLGRPRSPVLRLPRLLRPAAPGGTLPRGGGRLSTPSVRVRLLPMSSADRWFIARSTGGPALGRKSNAKRVRQLDPDFAGRKRAARAEIRGGRVVPTLEAYTQLVGHSGFDGLAEALIARHNRRFGGFASANVEMVSATVPSLSRLPLIDAILRDAGARSDRFPSDFLGPWVDNLAWATDSLVAVTRLLMVGQLVGAVGIARTQFERWTANVAFNRSLSRRAEESDEEFYERVWDGLAPPGFSVVDTFQAFSELLHGRGALLEALRWDARDLCSAPPSRAVLDATRLVMGLVRLLLRHLLICAVELSPSTRAVAETWPDLAALERSVGIAPPLLFPMGWHDIERFPAAVAAREAAAYRAVLRVVGEGRKPPLPPLMLGAFVERRERTFRWEHAALKGEQEQLGSSFDPDRLNSKTTQMIFISEAAALVGRWSGPRVADSFEVAASALRSAYWLWLEDDDRAMVPVRVVLEMAARARVWRVKPDMAARIEARQPRPSIRDWLEEAGWRRLGVIFRWLGELAHGSPRSVGRWYGAREGLATLVPHEYKGPPMLLARGTAVEAASRFLTAEVLAHLTELEPSVGAAFGRLVGIPAYDVSADIEKTLSRIWSKKPDAPAPSHWRPATSLLITQGLRSARS